MTSFRRRVKPILIALVLVALAFALRPADQLALASRTGSGAESLTANQTISLSDPPTNQVIIKYKASANLGGARGPAGSARMQELSNAAGVSLTYFREMSGQAHVLRLQERLPLAQVRQISDRLAALPDVEYAEPDAIMQHTLTPNDPQYANQWHYFDTYGINAPAAWDITTGASNIVIAVVNTGITNHTDLSGRTLPGYDFISTLSMANDGNGRDADPSDPGDWVAANECGYIHAAQNSSWHGTHVAGTIGAASNNGVGVAGINWVSKIVPVRVLGKCGGTLSDIADGMSWAAGLAVSGVPNNANPAKVINISLGGAGASCAATYQNAINAITAAGTSVIVAAGNSNINASGFQPANCAGVITVAATNRAGSRASYSNFGSIVKISAPGGETNPTASNGILSTLNTGTTVPLADTYTYYQGTSMATPHVVGVASLLYSLSPSLTPTQLQQILQNNVTAFPVGSTCNTSNCGSGIVNAGAAVAALLNTPTITSLNPSSATPGGLAFTLTVTGTNFVAGSVSVVRWNGANRTTTFVSATKLTAAIPATDIATAGTASVTVYNSNGGGASNAVSFSVGNAQKIYLPLVLNSSGTTSGWSTIISEDFEGAFPGSWSVFDNDGATNGWYYWSKRSCVPFAGSYSGWAIGGGANGSGLSCGANYPNNANSWMVYGPFSLSGTTAADLKYKLWLNSEMNYDWVKRMASTNGINFYGYQTSGTSSGAWIDNALDLAAVPTLGNLLGQPSVWIAITFTSDGSTNNPGGAYVDNIVLRKCPTGGTCPAGASAGVSSTSQIVEFPIEEKRVR